MTKEMSLWLDPDTGMANGPILYRRQWCNGFDTLHRPCSSSAPGPGKRQDLDDFNQYFARWGRAAQKLFSYINEAHVWPINETMPTKGVTTSGKVVLLGDACYAVLPNVGQGGGLAVEDAATLAECIFRAAVRDDIPKLLRM